MALIKDMISIRQQFSDWLIKLLPALPRPRRESNPVMIADYRCPSSASQRMLYGPIMWKTACSEIQNVELGEDGWETDPRAA